MPSNQHPIPPPPLDCPPSSQQTYPRLQLLLLLLFLPTNRTPPAAAAAAAAAAASLTCDEAGAVCQFSLSGEVQELHHELTVVPGVKVAAIHSQRTALNSTPDTTPAYNRLVNECYICSNEIHRGIHASHSPIITWFGCFQVTCMHIHPYMHAYIQSPAHGLLPNALSTLLQVATWIRSLQEARAKVKVQHS
jgi:hypothetical protein